VSGTTERLASSGLGGAAQWLFTETYPHLRRLLDEGYSINLLGHSLGGAVAALLGVLLREEGITSGRYRDPFSSDLVLGLGSPALISKAEALWTHLRWCWVGSCLQASSATRLALRRA
jgi:putative lipase involved disintegration of autophagic bodies